MEAARRGFKPEEILGAISLINHQVKACFIQGLSNEGIQTIVRSRGESILLSQAIEISLGKNVLFFQRKNNLPVQQMGPV